MAVALALLACRGRPLYQTSLLGLMLIPFLFYPSNYYCHFIFLLPLAVVPSDVGNTRDRTFAFTVAVLAAMCVSQYFTLQEGWSDLRYTYQSFVLLGGFGLILGRLAFATWQALKATPKPAES